MDDLIKRFVNDLFMEDEDGALMLSEFGCLFTIFAALGLFSYLIKGRDDNESNL